MVGHSALRWLWSARWRCRVDAEGRHEYTVGLDGRFRDNDFPPVALRGTWRRGNTFVVEFYVVGLSYRGTEQWIFEDYVLTIRQRESTVGDVATFVGDRVG